MKFFIDSANIEEIKKANEMGLVDGVTTNPSLVAKTGRPFEDVCREILALDVGPVSVEAISTDAAGMIAEGRNFCVNVCWGSGHGFDQGLHLSRRCFRCFGFCFQEILRGEETCN